ncbi:MAG: 23S rRNA (cytidine(2498)-2'-O)-methyltransferase RlmM [Sulfuriferula sp.]
MSQMDALLLYCRAGFEKECAAEIIANAEQLGVHGYVKAEPGSAWVLFQGASAEDISLLTTELPFYRQIFTRQWIRVSPLLENLPEGDRLSAVRARVAELAPRYSEVWVETPDTDAAKTRLGFCGRFTKPLTNALEKKNQLALGTSAPRLHVCFVADDAAFVGVIDADNSSPWFMGIPRVRVGKDAPSRSAGKLVEALMVMIPEDRAHELKAGMRAVDLGAAPGGWSWVLALRGIRVTAVDNGPMSAVAMATEMIEHVRGDGFSYRPHRPVNWLVCDMVESPSRIAQLVAEWIARGHARHAIFNLKLPMKKRLEEVRRCADIIEQRLAREDINYSIEIKQLYHDREEVTVCLMQDKALR